MTIVSAKCIVLESFFVPFYTNFVLKPTNKLQQEEFDPLHLYLEVRRRNRKFSFYILHKINHYALSVHS